MSLSSSITTIICLIVTALAAVVGHAAARPTRPCRACCGIGSQRGRRGRWAGHCAACRGSGQRDRWSTTVLVVVSRGRWLPRSGTVVRGHQHGQGYRFAGRHPGGRWRAAPDPDDTRLCALAERRVPAAERMVERCEAHEAARGLVKLWTFVREAAARRALRRVVEAAERHRDALAEHQGGYRAGTRRRVSRP